jgi:hypothetical protein
MGRSLVCHFSTSFDLPKSRTFSQKLMVKTCGRGFLDEESSEWFIYSYLITSILKMEVVASSKSNYVST